MKKILILIIVFTFTISSIYSKASDVSLVATIPETEVSYNLFYEDDLIADKTKEYEILVAPLTENGQTGDFTIKVNSNLNKNKSVKIVINPQKFKKTKNSKGVNNTQIRPDVSYKINNGILYAGLNTNIVVTKFFLYWSGDPNLPSGEYESNVIIEYKIT